MARGPPVTTSGLDPEPFSIAAALDIACARSTAPRLTANIPAALSRALQGACLDKLLKRRGASRVQLARRLGLQSSQLSNWLSGNELVPSHYWPRLGEELALPAHEMVDLIYIFEATARVSELERLFDKNAEQKKHPSQRRDRLALHFTTPSDVLLRLLRLIGSNLSKDVDAMPYDSPAQLLLMHVEAACRACTDIDVFLSKDAFNLFTEQNIGPHLTYPHHSYVAFFLTELTAADGPRARELQDSIFDALEVSVALRNSKNAADVRIAQHALHLLARYRGDPTAPYSHAADPETRRMAMFGEVYRSFDDGPFEELAHLITTDEPFGRATVDFDSLHYRDAKLGKGQPSAAPLNAISRHVSALADKRASMRRVASARVADMLRRIPPASLSNPALRSRIAAKRAAIESFIPSAAIEAEARDKLMAITQPDKPGDKR